MFPSIKDLYKYNNNINPNTNFFIQMYMTSIETIFNLVQFSPILRKRKESCKKEKTQKAIKKGKTSLASLCISNETKNMEKNCFLFCLIQVTGRPIRTEQLVSASDHFLANGLLCSKVSLHNKSMFFLEYGLDNAPDLTIEYHLVTFSE